MSYAVALRPRALREIEAARDNHARVGHGDTFLAEIELVLEALQAMPLRFPPIYGATHRALLRRDPFAVFCRIRPATSDVIVLAVLPQRANPARWPAR